MLPIKNVEHLSAQSKQNQNHRFIQFKWSTFKNINYDIQKRYVTQIQVITFWIK